MNRHVGKSLKVNNIRDLLIMESRSKQGILATSAPPWMHHCNVDITCGWLPYDSVLAKVSIYESIEKDQIA